MPSPKQITSSELLNTQKSCNDHKPNANQYEIVPTPNNGFIEGNSSLLLSSICPVKAVPEQTDVQVASMDKPGEISTRSGHQSPACGFREDSTQNVSFFGSDVTDSKCNDDNAKALPVEIVVVGNKSDKRHEKGSDSMSSQKEEANTFQNVSQSDDLRTAEKFLIRTPPDLSVDIQKPSKISKFKFASSSSSIQKSFPYSWCGQRSKLEKYLICTIVVLLLTFFIMYLTFSTKMECLGPEKKVCLRKECISTATSLLSAMDLTVHPCQNFFQFACGSWNKQHVIPEDKSSINTFEVMADQLQVILKNILEEKFGSREHNHSATRKAKLFYKSCMDIRQIQKVGDAPLREVLKQLGGWPVATPNWKPPTFSLETLLGKLRVEFNEGVLVEQWVGPDDKNSSANILQLDQMQLALPSRDYYLKSSSNAELQGYHKYMTQIAILLGANPATASQELEEVVKFEIKLANATLLEADRHDTGAMYRKLALNALQKEIPALNWTEYLSTFLNPKINEKEPIVSYATPYFLELGKILKETDTRVVHNYVIWRLVNKIVPHMAGEYQQAIVDFRKILLGILSERHRWSQCVDWTNKKLGMAVGALFIKDNFNHESMEMALEMIHTIREAFNELLEENVWMDEETRLLAKEKADSMNERVGYPELLTKEEDLNKEFINLTVTEDQFLLNVFNVLKYDANQNLQKLRQPVNKDKWSTEPTIVNAFYNPNKNDIVIPAGILQPLFYSQYFPKSLNYGGIGVVIGHEITHGFDDKGRQFDKDGNMKQWWNNATIKAFRKRIQCIIDQYSRYKLDETDLFVNGRMTQGENIADNGGLKQSFRAYKKWVAKHGEEPLLPGMNMTHDQLFFLNYAQIWCGSMRPEDALSKIRSSVHPPGSVRVWGPLSNSWDFAKAFNCPPTSPMNPTNKCTVW